MRNFVIMSRAIGVSGTISHHSLCWSRLPRLQFMIPDKPAGIDHFDINSFAVCLLSKDVQESAK